MPAAACCNKKTVLPDFVHEDIQLLRGVVEEIIPGIHLYMVDRESRIMHVVWTGVSPQSARLGSDVLQKIF
jgi:hypothetical protein